MGESIRADFYGKIYVDFHNADKHGRIRLITSGTLDEINSKNIILKSGLELVLYNNDDSNDVIIATAIVQFSEEEDIWVAKINR